MDLNWDWDCNMLFEEGCRRSEELPPRGAIAHVGQARPDWLHQVTWLGASGSSVRDFQARLVGQYYTREKAIAAVETTVKEAEHTVGGV